ncbi:phosphoenolpyruvate--protein phosphotransferase [Planctomycetota bacterium]
METRTGIPVSPGIAIAKAIVLDSEAHKIPRRCIDPEKCSAEVERAGKAFDEAVLELAELEAQHHKLGNMEIRDLFAVHRHFLQDQSLRQRVAEKIKAETVTAEYAVTTVLEELRLHFASVEDHYISERAADIVDIEKRLIVQLIGAKEMVLGEIHEDVIVLAKELRPTQTANFDPRYIKGIACDTGGETSHASIVARAMGIPAVVALEDLTESVRRDDLMIVDGNSGEVVVRPSNKTVRVYQEAARAMATFQASLQENRHEPAVTRDGVAITVLANIEFPYEAQTALELGAEGVGLFRTEFLFLQSGREPSEEDHYQAYAEVVKALDGRPVTIRTMDLGADKFTQSHRFAPETNPFLGLRSIRFSLRHHDMFVAQLRAILRSAALGPVKIMFPLISTLHELQQACQILADVQTDLEGKGIEYGRDIPVGIMIEVPAAAVMSKTLARHAAFFSIGTNDLTQYTLAVDRGNGQVADLFSSANPAVLNLIRMTVEGSQSTGISTSICGEMAAEPRYLMPLLGMGVRTLSLTPNTIPEIKRVIRSVNLSDCEVVAQKVLTMDHEREVTAFLNEQIRAAVPRGF